LDVEIGGRATPYPTPPKCQVLQVQLLCQRAKKHANLRRFCAKNVGFWTRRAGIEHRDPWIIGGIRDPDEASQYGLGIAKELGDVVFYVTWLANYFGFSLDDVVSQNMAKLEDRLSRNGTVKGDGDDR
jgi:hypothetical protein